MTTALSGDCQFDVDGYVAELAHLPPLQIPSSIGIGWAPAVQDALRQLDALAMQVAPQGIQIRVAQIKEKFGELRIYASAGLAHLRIDQDRQAELSSPDVAVATERVRAITRAAEAATGVICERCGAPAPKIRRLGSWLSRRCDACAREVHRAIVQSLAERWLAAAKVDPAWYPLLARALTQIAQLQCEVCDMEAADIRIRLAEITEVHGRIAMKWTVRRFGVAESEARNDPDLAAVRERVQRICADVEAASI